MNSSILSLKYRYCIDLKKLDIDPSLGMNLPAVSGDALKATKDADCGLEDD